MLQFASKEVEKIYNICSQVVENHHTGDCDEMWCMYCHVRYKANVTKQSHEKDCIVFSALEIQKIIEDGVNSGSVKSTVEVY